MAAKSDELELLTLTRLWTFPRFIFRIMDKPLGTPINLRLVAWAVPTFFAFWLLLTYTPIRLRTAQGLGLVPHLVLPGLVVWWALTQVGQGARPWEMAWSWLRLAWHARPRWLVRHVQARHPRLMKVRIRSRVREKCRCRHRG